MSAAELLPAAQVFPELRPNVDFFAVALRDGEEPFLLFDRCPCCGRAREEVTRLRDGVAEMQFFHPVLSGGWIGYLMHTRCARRVAGKAPRASELSNKVALAVLGAVAAMERLTGHDPVVCVVDDLSVFVAGSEVPS